ncbi:sugar-phosphatase [Terrilactibacillus laevilacticus]|uniref:sugar-phosphatase n=1 Tax=Terrilactibacillus laevilacticus TaxID=1380157 RepID=UPI00114656D1|nr:sugar-phosphatase [Terrilactibacillus laevilacticus]
MIKLIAIDLDGTLLNNEKKITDRTKDALKKAKNQGVKIVLCTGRPLLGMVQYLDELNLREDEDYGITYNGGLVQRTKTGEVISEITMSKKDIESLYELSQTLEVPMNFIDLERVYSPAPPNGKPSLYGEIMKALPFVTSDIRSLPEDIKINKALFCIDQPILDAAINKIPCSFFENYTMMKSRPVLLEIMNKNVDKGKGLQALGQHLGIKQEEMMTFGDEENDLAMIEYAGLGVAMGNAIDKVKDAAQFITLTNEENGVAYAVEKFVINK